MPLNQPRRTGYHAPPMGNPNLPRGNPPMPESSMSMHNSPMLPMGSPVIHAQIPTLTTTNPEEYPPLLQFSEWKNIAQVYSYSIYISDQYNFPVANDAIQYHKHGFSFNFTWNGPLVLRTPTKISIVGQYSYVYMKNNRFYSHLRLFT